MAASSVCARGLPVVKVNGFHRQRSEARAIKADDLKQN